MDLKNFYNYKQLESNIDFSKFKNKKVLITGSTGLIGLHMLAVLKNIQKKYNISIFCWINNDIESIYSDLFTDCTIIKGDLTDNKNIENLKLEFIEILSGIDFIIHTAGYGQPQKFMQDKITTIELNTSTVVNLFKLLNKGGSFLFCSTSEIYSGIEEESISEERIGSTNPAHPRSCYIEAKRCGEAICHAFAPDFNIKIARISLVYGPGTKKNDARVLNNIIQKALLNNKIDLLDTGSSIRTYCYISDAVEMLYNILLHGNENVYNIAGTSKISIYKLAQIIADKLHVDVNIPIDDNKTLNGTPKIVNLDINKYINEFNKKSFIEINDGLNYTIEWQKDLYYGK